MANSTADKVVDFTDLNAVLEAANLAPTKQNRAQMQKRLLELAHLAYARWRQIASQKLHSSQRRYLNALQVVRSESGGASVVLEHESSDGKLARMVEWGSNGLDLRQILLTHVRPGAKPIRYTKNGMAYRIIPFRRMTAEATGRNFPVMGRAYDAQMGVSASNAFRSSIIETLAKRKGMQEKAATFNDPNTGKPIKRSYTTKWGTPISAAEGGPKLLGFHKGGLYSGMYRVSGRGKNSGSQYIMFRTVHKNSPGWQQGPITARKISEDVLRYVADIAPEIVGAPIEARIE